MDKRWLAILIIIIIASGCVYLIAQFSPSVGNAITDVNKTSITVPNDFSVKSPDAASTNLINKNTHENIYVKDISNKDCSQERFENSLKKISKSNDKQVLDNTTNTTESGITIYTIHYTKLDDNGNANNLSIAYFYNAGHTFYLKLSGFDNIDRTNEQIEFIADTMHPDYKKSQDPQETQDQSDLAVKYEKKVKNQG